MNHTARSLLAGFTVAAVMTVPGAAPASSVHIVQDVSGPGTRDVDFYVPDSADGTAPLVVILHGGGNKGNTGLEALAATVALRGAVVAVPSYFSGQPRSRADVHETFRNVICSIRYARSRAAEFGADPGNLTVVGFSYGGYPASAVALAPHSAYSYDCLTHISHVPEAFVGLAGAYSYDHAIATLGWTEDFTQFTTLGNLGNNPEVQISLLHGARDTNVPAEIAETLHTELHQAGYTVALHIADTRHAELIDPTDPAGALAVDTILAATHHQIEAGRTGPATTSIYQRLAAQRR